MKRFVLMLVIFMVASFIFASDGVDAQAIEGGSRNRPVSFIDNPFVRIGFASAPVISIQEPDPKIVQSAWPIKKEENAKELKTDSIYLYCQVFTPTTVKLKIKAPPLSVKSGGVDRTWSWHATFNGYGRTMAAESVIDINSSDQETGKEFYIEANDVDCSLSRIYCWEFSVILDNPSEGNLPVPPNEGTVPSTDITFIVSSV